MVTRKTPETKVLVEWPWGAHRYAKDELTEAFSEGGLRGLRFVRFPFRYGWLNSANWIAVASAPRCRSDHVSEANSDAKSRSSRSRTGFRNHFRYTLPPCQPGAAPPTLVSR